MFCIKAIQQPERFHRDTEVEALLLGAFGKVQSMMDDRSFLFSRISLECAPTLQGLKPATLLCFPCCGRNLLAIWEKYQDQAKHELGLDHYEVGSSTNHCSVLFFQREILATMLQTDNNIAFLRESGYDGELTIEAVLQGLQHKMQHDYPHEIGLLLGIPPADIRGFIANQGAGCLLCGYWKVYHDPHQASALFKTYDNAKKAIMKKIISFYTPLPASA